jgi:hypothetical protein
MKLLNLGATILSVISLVAGQQQVTSSSTTSQIISQYGSSFKNAGGSVLSDKVNGKALPPFFLFLLLLTMISL